MFGVACSTLPPATQEEVATTTTTWKLTVAGDSISIGLGAALRNHTPAGVDVKVIGEEGTGLARPDVFDWPVRLAELARDFPPAILVLSLSSNDAQDLTDPDGSVVVPFTDTSTWEATYRRRLEAAVAPFESTGTTVVWVGHLRLPGEPAGSVNRRVHDLATEVAAERPWVVVADLAELLGVGDSDVVVGGVEDSDVVVGAAEDGAAEDGAAGACLREDGVHLTGTCLSRAAEVLASRLPGWRGVSPQAARPGSQTGMDDVAGS